MSSSLPNQIWSVDQLWSTFRIMGRRHEPRIFVDRRLHYCSSKEYKNMLWTIFVILLVLWALGLVTSYTLGGFIHILLLLAVIVLVLRLFSGRRIA
jgi:hypothetical protein